MAYSTYQDFIDDLLTVPGVTSATGEDLVSYFRYTFTINGLTRYGSLSLQLLTQEQALSTLQSNVAELHSIYS